MTAKKLLNDLTAEISKIYEHREAQAIAFLMIKNMYGLPKTKVMVDDLVPNYDQKILENILTRILTYEPPQYVFSTAYFYGKKLFVDSSVLIPRPETEELVDWIISENKEKDQLTILDIGTGSACIPIALLDLMPKTQMYAIDFQENSLKTAKKNAQKHQANIHFLQADILTNDLQDLPKFDIIVSNPPYIPLQEKTIMQKNVLEHEPAHALFVPNENPLLFYERIAILAKSKLHLQGQIYVEIHENFGDKTVKLFKKYGFKQIILKKDINDKDRMLKCIWA
ncbi:MAG: peptide chain release factor N(5)-glutamine methyltransferase [Bacteroidetes bacterium]|nr:MAG: peptide chain release factor N(5)-glutamine methyltransferase [Bacteroidota bacterium]